MRRLPKKAPKKAPKTKLKVMRTLKVRVVAYKGKIILVPDKPGEGIGDRWWPTGGSRLGCVVGDTKTRLGVSQDAQDLMRKVRRNRGDLGDLGWWTCDNGTHAFSWFGPLYRVIDPKTDEANRNFQVFPEQCVRIPNAVPEEARRVLDAYPDAPVWNDPASIT